MTTTTNYRKVVSQSQITEANLKQESALKKKNRIKKNKLFENHSVPEMIAFFF